MQTRFLFGSKKAQNKAQPPPRTVRPEILSGVTGAATM